MPETTEKLSRIRKYLAAKKLDAVVFNTRANVAWLSGGADSHVVSQSERAFGSLVVTPKSALLVANRIEIERLAHEEPLSSFTAKPFPWTQSLPEALGKLVSGSHVVSDDSEATGFKAIDGNALYEMRASLTDAEIRRYKALGRDCAVIIETVARQIQKGDSEHQVEADLARHLLARGIQPHVLLVAFDQRIDKYRHPVPTANHLRVNGMLVVCGQRGGLIVSLTRLFHFGAMVPELAAKHEACCKVEAALWEATVPGATWGDAFKAGQAAYKAVGHAKEWELHHQGGPTGYAGRDFCATPDEKRKIFDHQAVAWNPSITGTKSEDTFIIEGGNRSVITACTGDWPMISVKVPGGKELKRPAILVR